MSTIPNQSTACWPLSSHQHCFSYLLGKWCFLVPKNSFTEYFSRFLFSPTLSLYALNLRPKSPQKTLLLVQFFLLSWKEEKYVGEKFFLTYDRIIITTGICPKTFAPIYPHYKSFDSYIKPQLVAPILVTPTSCISFDSYIKPQQVLPHNHRWRVVYLLIPTSNHNFYYLPSAPWKLYIFWFLHQTTTLCSSYWWRTSCISFDSYIKPQHTKSLRGRQRGCISFDSYIKPQPIEYNMLIHNIYQSLLLIRNGVQDIISNAKVLTIVR